MNLSQIQQRRIYVHGLYAIESNAKKKKEKKERQ